MKTLTFCLIGVLTFLGLVFLCVSIFGDELGALLGVVATAALIKLCEVAGLFAPGPDADGVIRIKGEPHERDPWHWR